MSGAQLVPLNAPSMTARLHLLALLLAGALFALPVRSRELALEVLPPRPLIDGTSRGFHDRLTVHETDFLGRWTARYHEVKLYGGIVAVGEYYARIKVGGQTVRVQIDTGSATLALPMTECDSCKAGDMRYDIHKSKTGQARVISCEDDECQPHKCSTFGCGACSSRRACCAFSNKSQCSFHLSFGDGSGAKGVLVRDVLQWGDVKFPVTFGGIRHDSPDFERNQVDGILGMAYPRLACNPSCVTPAFESARDHLGLKDMFSICMTDDGGKITLGDFDPLMAINKVTWVPMRLTDPKTFYDMNLQGQLRIGSRTLRLPSYRRAIVDSGTTLIVFSKYAFRLFVQHLQAHYCDVPHLCDHHTWFRPAHCVRIADEDRLKLPTLVFELEGFNVTLNANEYMINYKSKGPDYWCVGLMALDSMSGGVDVIFGNTVMKKYITVYDRKNERVGFAESGGNCNQKIRSNPGALPVKKPEMKGKNPRRAGLGHRPAGAAAAAAVTGKTSVCSAAKMCGDCEKLGETERCYWNIPDGACVPGEPTKFMCAIGNLFSHLGYVIAGIVIAAVVVVALIFVVVCIIRKRRNAGEEAAVSEGELEETTTPLAPQRR